jgi:uncharacterized protein YjiS (DUF1127 family)
MRITKMKLLQIAVASIVDANTGYGLAHSGGSIDYPAQARHGRSIRAKSIVALYGLAKEQLHKAISRYHEHVKQRRQLALLGQLNDHLLRDIGLSRGDLIAAESGQVNLQQLDAKRRSGKQNELPDLTTADRVDPQTLQLSAINEAVYAEAKCA